MRTLRRALTSIVLVSIAGSLSAQRQFDELAKGALPHHLEDSRTVAVGDVDGDGDPDVLVGNLHTGSDLLQQRTRLLLNDGTGWFEDVTSARLPLHLDATNSISLGDIDGDGDLDAIVGNAGPDRLLINDGTGGFTDGSSARLPADGDDTRSVAFGDVDGDGDLDLVAGNHGFAGAANRLYLNDGSGHFADATTGRLPLDTDRTHWVLLGDVDGDGDADLLTGNVGANRLYLNDGFGTFSGATAGRLPADVFETCCLVLGDVDGDGDPDLVAGDPGEIHLYRNDGTGWFTPAPSGGSPSGLGWPPDIALGDVDGDGDLDLVAALSNALPGVQNRVYLNDGHGGFTDETDGRLPDHIEPTHALALADLDTDGDLDIFFANDSKRGEFNRLCLNDGAGRFADATARRLPARGDDTRQLVLGDVDNDGDLDVVAANESGANRLHVNDGRGWFTDESETRLPPAFGFSSGLALADVDQDGDLDVVAANGAPGSGGQNRLLLNDGQGRFSDHTASRMPTDQRRTSRVAAADVDGDGDLDLLFANLRATNSLYLNDGAGSFTDVTPTHMPTSDDQPSAIVLGDVDSDGDIDVLFGNPLADPDALCINDGSGIFTNPSVDRFSHTTFSRDAALTDVDLDGDLDYLSLGPALKLFRNDGAGSFQLVESPPMPSTPGHSVAMAVDDLNEDGFPDIFVGERVGLTTDRLLFNDGTGVFLDVSDARMPTRRDHTEAVATGDLDGDGDVDLLLGNSFDPDHVCVNLTRQLHAPRLLVTGRKYTLDVYARDDVPGLVDVALPVLSASSARIPLPPLGTVGVDPSTMIPIAPFLLSPTDRRGTIDIDVPRSAGLIGAPVYAQALLLRYPFDERLTNVTRDLVLR